MDLIYKKKKISIKVKKLSELGKIRGLMFRSSENSQNFLFQFKKKSMHSLHSLFVFFPFLVLWIDGDEVKEIKAVKPFQLSLKPSKNYNRCIEIPLNKKNKKIINFFDGEERFK